MTKEELKVYVDEELARVVESIRDESLQTPEMWDMSKSEAARELLEHSVDVLGENPDLEELVDDVSLEVYRKQQKQDRLQERGRIVEMSGGWRGRVRSRFNARLAGTEPYHPEKMEELRELYWGEITTWEDDEERYPEHRDWLDELYQDYRDAYEAKQVVPDEAFANVDDVSTGADLLKLRNQFGEVLRDIADVAEAEAYDVEAIYQRLAGDYAVDEETVELVVEELTSDDVDARRALKSGDGILGAVDREALTSWGGDVAALEGDDRDDQEVEVEPRDKLVSTAVEMLQSGAEVDMIREELTGMANGIEINAAIDAALEEVEGDVPGPDGLLAKATDGGVESD